YLYSTWIYIHRELQAKYPEIKITVIPGIVSIFTFASKVGISIAEGSETVAVIPSCYDLSRVKETAKNCDTMIFLKDGRYFDQVIQLLKDAGFPDSSIFAVGQDLGTKEEIVKKLTLGEVTENSFTTKYFSIMVVKRA
ncbi:MAG: SAM-dependent methyltransferase, partial [Thaumarchaeota archaeon]|nr:SAM-dependent methyltransferase [Nitrososphaerota archaeon]